MQNKDKQPEEGKQQKEQQNNKPYSGGIREYIVTKETTDISQDTKKNI